MLEFILNYIYFTWRGFNFKSGQNSILNLSASYFQFRFKIWTPEISMHLFGIFTILPQVQDRAARPGARFNDGLTADKHLELIGSSRVTALCAIKDDEDFTT